MNSLSVFIISFSFLLQLLSSLVVLLLIVHIKKRIIAFMMFIAAVLMAYRRSVPLQHLIAGSETTIDLPAEIAGCAVSLFLLTGFLYLNRVIAHLREERDKSAQTERALGETSARLETLIHAIPDLIIFKDVEGRHLVVNKAAEEFLGLPHEELVGKTNEDLLPPELAMLCRKGDQEVIMSRTVLQSEEPVLGKNGQTIYLDTLKAAIRDDAGNPKGIVAVSRDITGRKQIEEGLKNAVIRANEERARTESIIAAIGDGINIQDTDYKVVFQNEISKIFYGDHIGEYCYKAFQNQDRACERCHLTLAFKDGNVHSFEQKRVTDKGTVYYEKTGSPVRDGEGKIVAGIELIRDVTERKLAEEATRKAMQQAYEEKAKSEAVISAIGDSLVVVDRDFRVVYQNQVDREIMGNVVGEICYRAFEGRDSVCDSCPVELSLSDGLVHRAERTAVISKGRTMHLDITASPLRDESGNVLAVVEMVRDITERRRMEDALRKSEADYRSLLEQASDGIAVIDRHGRYLDVNTRMCDMLGYSREEFLNLRTLDLVAAEERSGVPANLQEILEGKTVLIEHVLVGKDGSRFHVEISAKMIADGRLLGIHRDITERRKLLEQLEHFNSNLAERVRQEIEKNRTKEQLLQLQSRHAAMGEMIDNIAHQWRQPLNNLGLIMQGVQKRFIEGRLTTERMQEQAKIGMSLIRYMSQTINDFTNFFRHDKAIVEFRIKDVVSTALSFMETSLKRNAISVVTDIHRDITIKGYRNEYTQVLVNILNNARDILVERGIRKPVISMTAFAENGSSVLTITDNGGGISDEVLDRIFRPYFTTKTQNKGTGIGLYMSKMIIENNMRGMLSACNKGDGAEFRIEVRNDG